MAQPNTRFPEYSRGSRGTVWESVETWAQMAKVRSHPDRTFACLPLIMLSIAVQRDVHCFPTGTVTVFAFHTTTTYLGANMPKYGRDGTVLWPFGHTSPHFPTRSHAILRKSIVWVEPCCEILRKQSARVGPDCEFLRKLNV